MTATLLPISTPPLADKLVMTVADLLESLGGIPPSRVRIVPSPGTATEQHLIEIERRAGQLFELVDGTLVEKAMGFNESVLGGAIYAAIYEFVRPRQLGYVAMADAMMRILPGQVRLPDVSFTSRRRFPGGRLGKEAIADVSPDLAIEVLSESNTKNEIDRKLREYFQGGTRLVWIVDPIARTIAVYTNPDTPVIFTANQALDGGDVLPGFTLELKQVFAVLDE